MEKRYKVRIKRGDNEIEVDTTEKDFAVSKLTEYYPDMFGEGPPKAGKSEVPRTSITGKKKSLPELQKEIKATTLHGKITLIVYYYENYENRPGANKGEITIALLKTLKTQSKNPTDRITATVSKGLITEDPENPELYITTDTGVKWVEGRLDDK